MIKDNNVLNQYKESKRIIRQAMEEKQLVLFVGAGASIASGMPTWGQAIRDIAALLSIPDEDLDYLRIPQYFFNARGKKEYTQLMRKIFKHGEYLLKHEIHDKIIRFNTETIITTNYDHLIEQAAEDNSEILSVVSKDADLSYRRGGKELIKMHGDFENDNFVLKEDDYLAYSRNFKLIENYVKSLIGTKVVLFIGYSFNDPDLKLIFSWVKDILGGDFQRAYLIQSGKEYDINEAEYFKNFGINLLYSSIQLQDQYDEDNLTNNLLLMLKWLLSPDENDSITVLYEELKPFLSMNYANQKYVKNALFSVGITAEKGSISLVQGHRFNNDEALYIIKSIAYEQWVISKKNIVLPDDLLRAIYNKYDEGIFKEKQEENNKYLIEYFKEFNPGDKQGIIRQVLDVLYRSNIHYIDLYLPSKERSGALVQVIIPLSHFSCPKWMEDVDTFNYTVLAKIAKQNNAHLDETKPELYMQQGYIHFILENYLESYNCYKNAKSIFYKRQEYVNLFLAEFNRFILGKMISSGNGVFYNIDAKDVNEVRDEIKSINLDRLFNSLPDLGSANKALKDIYTFNIAYTLFQDAYRSSIKVSDEANNRYTLFSGTAAFAKMRESVRDYYTYISRNFLPLNNYTEHISIFQVYFHSIVNSVMTTIDSEPFDNNRVYNIHADKLEAFDLLVGLKFVKVKELEKTMKSYINNLPIDSEALDYLERVVHNCCRKERNSFFAEDSVFWKCVVLLGHCNLSKSIVSTSIVKMNELILEIDYRIHSKCIIDFIYNAEKQDLLSEEDYKQIEKLLEKEFSALSKDKSITDSLTSITLDLLWILKENNNAFNKVNYINPLLDDSSRLFCASIYPLLGENAKKVIYEAYYTWELEDSNSDIEFYCALVNANIIEPNSNSEQKIIEFYNNKSKNLQKNISGLVLVQDDEVLIYRLLELYLNDLIIDKEAFKEIIVQKNIVESEWLMNLKNFDYQLFDVNWLGICQKRLLDEISNHDDIREKIKKRIEEEYSSGNLSKKIVDIYFMYFASKK